MNEAQSIASADASIYMAITGRTPVVEKPSPETNRGARNVLQWVIRAPRMTFQKVTSAFDFVRDFKAALPE